MSPDIQCKVCKKFFKSNCILKHISRAKNCKKLYEKADIDALKQNSKSQHILAIKYWKKTHTDQEKNKKANWYKKKKENIAKFKKELEKKNSYNQMRYYLSLIHI